VRLPVHFRQAQTRGDVAFKEFILAVEGVVGRPAAFATTAKDRVGVKTENERFLRAALGQILERFLHGSASTSLDCAGRMD
jgi:hypothetical protein